MTPYISEENGAWVVNHGSIAKRYLKTWFPVGFDSVLPFDAIGGMMNSDDMSQLKVLRVIRLFRLAKLLPRSACS